MPCLPVFESINYSAYDLTGLGKGEQQEAVQPGTVPEGSHRHCLEIREHRRTVT
jgi:hypothetical protein